MDRQNLIASLIDSSKFVEASQFTKANTLSDSNWHFSNGKYFRVLTLKEPAAILEMEQLLNSCPGHINRFWMNTGLTYSLCGDQD